MQISEVPLTQLYHSYPDTNYAKMKDSRSALSSTSMHVEHSHNSNKLKCIGKVTARLRAELSARFKRNVTFEHHFYVKFVENRADAMLAHNKFDCFEPLWRASESMKFINYEVNIICIAAQTHYIQPR